MSRLFLIDGHAYIHRAYHALPPLTNSKGQPVNAVYGFVRMVLKILKQEKPEHLIVCFDTHAPTFRHEAYPDYKVTRKEMEDNLKTQIPLVREAVQALNLATCELDGFEADDLIAHLTREGTRKGWDVVIVSADKDTLQLVNDHVKVLSEPKNILYDAGKVQERYGLPPTRLPDYFALIGDTSDNVKGVPGIGPKTAAKLLQEHGDLEALLKAAPKIKGKTGEILQAHAATARESRSLVVLEHDVPLQIDWQDAVVKPPQEAVLSPFLQRMEFYSLLDEIIPPQNAVSGSPEVSAPAGDYEAITDEAALEKWFLEVKGEGQLAIEVITRGMDATRAELLGIAISFKAGSARYIPLVRTEWANRGFLTLNAIQHYLKGVFRGQTHLLYGHDLKFIDLVLKRYGLGLGKLHCDTMVASYVLNPSRSGHALKELAMETLGERMISLDQLTGKGTQQIEIDQLPIDKLTEYACAKVDAALRIAQTLEKQIKEKKLDKLFYEMEMPLIQVLANMEELGIRIDRSYLAKLGVTLKQRVEELEKHIYELAGGPFNVNSPKQLASVLFEKLKLPVVRRTKTGFSTDEEVLKTLSASHPMPAALMEFRELQKLRSTYIEGLQVDLLPTDDRIHTHFNQTVAATGRLSSSSPNLQNIPIRTELGRQIRKAFIPKVDHVFLSADYSQIDLRVLAHITQDKTLVEAYKKGEDIHLRTASEIFKVSAKDTTPEMRRAAKSINFGIVYGMSAFGLSQQLQIPAEEAKQYIDRYFERYTGVKKWIEQILEEARKNGYVKTLLGRVRYLPEILSKNSAVRGFAERTAMNTPIQGTSADIIKVAMLHLQEAQQKREWDGEMLLQVHDELLFEVPPFELPKTAKRIKQLMEQALPLSVPVVVDLKTGPNWSEMGRS